MERTGFDGTASARLLALWTWLAGTLRTAAVRSRSLGRRGYRSVRSRLRWFGTVLRRLLDGPVKRFVNGPLRTGLLGRRLDCSLVIALLAPVLAGVSAWWVGSRVGFGTLELWVRGTWTGTDPSGFVFASVALLVALGTLSVAVNAGLVPTTLLVAGPVFGGAVTRYGTTVTHSWGTTVVSLPEAVGVATLLAVGLGVPVAICSFLLGVALRRVVTVLYTPMAGDG